MHYIMFKLRSWCIMHIGVEIVKFIYIFKIILNLYVLFGWNRFVIYVWDFVHDACCVYPFLLGVVQQVWDRAGEGLSPATSERQWLVTTSLLAQPNLIKKMFALTSPIVLLVCICVLYVKLIMCMTYIYTNNIIEYISIWTCVWGCWGHVLRVSQNM